MKSPNILVTVSGYRAESLLANGLSLQRRIRGHR